MRKKRGKKKKKGYMKPLCVSVAATETRRPLAKLNANTLRPPMNPIPLHHPPPPLDAINRAACGGKKKKRERSHLF